MNVRDLIIGMTAAGGGGGSPSGSIYITENGDYDVSSVATATVDVSGGGGGGDNTVFARAMAKASSDTALLELPEDITAIGESSLAYGSWGSITGYGVQSIGNYGCQGVQAASVDFMFCKSIGNYGFQNSKKLETFNMPFLETIGEGAFWGCSKLALTDLPGTLTSLGNRAFQSTRISIMSIPEGVGFIPEYCFYGCPNLDYLDIYYPQDGLYIGNQAFAGSGLTTVKFYAKPSNINVMAFANCPKLKTIFVPWSEGQVYGAPWGATNASIEYDSV